MNKDSAATVVNLLITFNRVGLFFTGYDVKIESIRGFLKEWGD